MFVVVLLNAIDGKVSELIHVLQRLISNRLASKSR